MVSTYKGLSVMYNAHTQLYDQRKQGNRGDSNNPQ